MGELLLRGEEEDLAPPIVERRTRRSCTDRGWLLGEEEEANLDGERPTVGWRTRRTCTERGRLLDEEEEADLAWRKAGCSVKKKKQILRGERTCTERGRPLGREVVGTGWAAVGWRRRPCTEKKQTENYRDFAPKSWSGKEEERWQKIERCGITTWHV
ncbi:hypothetical protein SLEP1_g12562 [Rubroshorea leprosula]|uniref:Uncharacterized protein n=1 Tax=Rubroshorea leprosula TaxID=152421 RepID=A0AAV5IMQ7_9ROSI|nr:hypothetical protein SLEP1_g12562 [Rubroshorea leprosula]